MIKKTKTINNFCLVFKIKHGCFYLHEDSSQTQVCMVIVLSCLILSQPGKIPSPWWYVHQKAFTERSKRGRWCWVDGQLWKNGHEVRKRGY